MAGTKAWLLDFGSSCRAAVGERVLLHLVDQPEIREVPQAPPYCLGVFDWQGRSLPVLDMAARLGMASRPPRVLAVVGYQEQQGGKPCFGVLALAAPPIQLVVGDEQACALPETPTGWGEFASSCFEYKKEPVPILHPGKIFAGLFELGAGSKM